MQKLVSNSIPLGLAGLLSVGAEASGFINFESDPSGPFLNGSSSLNSPLVTFSNLSPSDGMAIFNSGFDDTIGQSLVVFPESTGVTLRMDFSDPIYSLSLMFGNDDPFLLVQGLGSGFDDLAVLNLFDGSTLLETITVLPNANTAMDQTIAWTHSGTPANRAEFFYGDSNLNPIDLIETVDNIAFSTEVPEPSTYAAIAFAGAVGVWSWRRSRKA
jgi:hypothetical protein